MDTMEMKLEYAEKIFDKEMCALKEKAGEDPAARAFLVFSAALNWLRNDGHGNLIISALDHSFGLKIKTETVISIKD